MAKRSNCNVVLFEPSHLLPSNACGYAYFITLIIWCFSTAHSPISQDIILSNRVIQKIFVLSFYSFTLIINVQMSKQHGSKLNVTTHKLYSIFIVECLIAEQYNMQWSESSINALIDSCFMNKYLTDFLMLPSYSFNMIVSAGVNFNTIHNSEQTVTYHAKIVLPFSLPCVVYEIWRKRILNSYSILASSQASSNSLY